MKSLRVGVGVVGIKNVSVIVSEKSPELLPRPELLEEFKSLVRQAWSKTLDLVAEARKAKH